MNLEVPGTNQAIQKKSNVDDVRSKFTNSIKGSNIDLVTEQKITKTTITSYRHIKFS